jgi:hypothetical protein
VIPRRPANAAAAECANFPPRVYLDSSYGDTMRVRDFVSSLSGLEKHRPQLFQTGGVFGLFEYAANTGYSNFNALRIVLGRPATYHCFFATFCAG